MRVTPIRPIAYVGRFPQKQREMGNGKGNDRRASAVGAKSGTQEAEPLYKPRLHK